MAADQQGWPSNCATVYLFCQCLALGTQASQLGGGALRSSMTSSSSWRSTRGPSLPQHSPCVSWPKPDTERTGQVKEIIYPGGAEIDIRAIRVGDPSLSVLEIWGAEYQENDCLLIRPESRGTLAGICARERCPMQARPCPRQMLDDICTGIIAAGCAGAAPLLTMQGVR